MAGDRLTHRFPRWAPAALLCVAAVAEDAGAIVRPAAVDSTPRRGTRSAQSGRSASRTPTPAAGTSARPANGTLVFIANAAGASVSVDGRPVAGGIAERPPGTYHVRVTAPGRLPVTAEPTIARAGQVVTIRANLPPDPAQLAASGARDGGQLAVSDMRPPPSAGDGLLTVLSEPSATVRLDGDSLGVTPLRGVSVPAGEYYLRLTRAGYRDAEQMITVRRGATTSVTMSLRP